MSSDPDLKVRVQDNKRRRDDAWQEALEKHAPAGEDDGQAVTDAGASAPVTENLKRGPEDAGAPAPRKVKLTQGEKRDAGASAPSADKKVKLTQGEKRDLDAGASAPVKKKPAPDIDADASIEDLFEFFNLTCNDDSFAEGSLMEMSLCQMPARLQKRSKMTAAAVPPEFKIPTKGSRPQVAEIFSPPRLTASAAKFNLIPGLALDLRTGWDLDNPRHVAAAWKYLREAKPYLLLGSPECKAFSTMQIMNKSNPAYAETHRRGMKHLKLVCEMYQHQIENGRLFIHEHPWYATSWGVGAMKTITKQKGVLTAYVDQCMYGQQVFSEGDWGLAKKPTGFATNSKFIFERLQKSCDKSHEHKSLMGGVAVQAAAYPSQLVDQILRGLKDHISDLGRLEQFDGGGPTLDEPEPERPWKRYYDEITGAELDAKLVREARVAEIAYMKKLNVYVESTLDECKRAGCVPIPMRWIDINKGDAARPNIRCRAVLQETKARSKLGPNDIATTFAATPPLEGLRLLVSLAMTGQVGVAAQARRVLGFYDVSRAHFHFPAKREMWVKVLPEDPDIKSGVAKLLKAMYGGRDAGNCWDQFAEETMAKLGYAAGVYSTCMYYNKSEDALCWRHGDDFVLLHTREGHSKF